MSFKIVEGDVTLRDSSGVEKGVAANPVRIDAASLPLPTGAATQATLADILGQLDTTLTSLRDALRGTGDKTLTDLETTLDAIKDIDGIKKITDQLPAGTNIIGLVKLTDGSDTAEVTNDGRLRVDATAAAGAGVVNDLLTNGGSGEMAIDGGAGTVFSWSPGSTYDVEGVSISLIMEDATIYFGDKWAGINNLTNGVLIEAKANDVEFTVTNLQRTRELLQICGPGGFEVFAATPDCVKGEISVSGMLFRKAGTFTSDDYIRVTIRDDLSGLTHQSVLFKGTEIA